MSNIKLSIITVVRNSVSTIEQTILSVLKQTYYPIEYIIVDGVSTDGTLEIIKEFEFKIKNNFFTNFQLKSSTSESPNLNNSSIFLCISEPDKGIYDAINKGINISSGEYIGLIHSSDWYETNACETIKNEIENDNSFYGMYYGMIRIFSSKGEHLKTGGSTMNLISSEMIAHPSCFVKSNIYKDLFKYNLKYYSAADYDFMLRLSNTNIKTKRIVCKVY